MQTIKPILTLAPMLAAGVYVSTAPISLAVTAVATAALAFLGSVLAPSQVDKVLGLFFTGEGKPEVAVLPFALLAPIVPTIGVPLLASLLGAQIARSLDWNRGLRVAVQGVVRQAQERGIEGLLDAGQRALAGEGVRTMHQEFTDGLRLLEQRYHDFSRYLQQLEEQERA
jgi:hypothetical protein